MADTQQTITALKAVLADNTSQAISPQDVRDIVETMRAGYAGMYVSSSSATTIGVAGTFVKAAGTTTLVTDPAAVNWSMPTDNRLLYGGTADRVVQVVASISMQAAAANVNVSWRLAKNGTTIAATEITRKIATGGDNGAAAISGLVEVTNGDYIELWITNETSATNATVTKMMMTVADLAL